MVSKEVKEEMRGKLNAAITKDLKGTEIKRNINNIKETDGRFIADFNIIGKFPQKGNTTYQQSNYNDYTKIFDNLDDFNTYAKSFFNANADDLAELIKNK